MSVTIENITAFSHNQFYRIMRGRYVIAKKGREYKKLVQDSLNGIVPSKNKIRLMIEVFYSSKRIRDVDNVCKPLLDALKGFVYVDDSQIYELEIKKHIGEPTNKIIISWKELN